LSPCTSTSHAYTPSLHDALPIFKGELRDKDGGVSGYSADVTVNNVAPTATFNNNGPRNEGSDINLSLTGASDPSSVDTAAGFEYRFSCDDGTTWSAWKIGRASCRETNDNGTRHVKGELRDKDGGVSSYSADMTFNNGESPASIRVLVPCNEGSDINLSLTGASDPSSVDTAAGFEYRFSCDDGTTWSAWSSTSSASCSTNDNGTRHVKGELRDKDGRSEEHTSELQSLAY